MGNRHRLKVDFSEFNNINDPPLMKYKERKKRVQKERHKKGYRKKDRKKGTERTTEKRVQKERQTDSFSLRGKSWVLPVSWRTKTGWWHINGLILLLKRATIQSRFRASLRTEVSSEDETAGCEDEESSQEIRPQTYPEL